MKLDDVKGNKDNKKASQIEKDVIEYNIPHTEKDHANHSSRVDSLKIIKKVNPDLFDRIKNWD